ncbi:MAG TPA: nitroreductase family deazaflavin-dependent oxidoreductase [Acidimicrobiia bacterium]|nr:nitroreductase family deazaflavin-dependent oxidoreductase [Acidimicrobiia bacterium]
MRDSTVRRLSQIHRRLFRLSRGWVGQRLVENDMLLLSTEGRRTGRQHEVPLLYLRDGDRLLLIASYGGRPHHPDWYLNLVENPKVTVQIGGGRLSMTAKLADHAERAIWWPKVVEAYSAYQEYQARTERSIPLVFLQPEPGQRH